jgi:hypothetical protein
MGCSDCGFTNVLNPTKKPLRGLKGFLILRFAESLSAMQGLGGKALTALGASSGHDFLAVFGSHTATKPMTALAYKTAWLICAFHVRHSGL